MTTSSTPDTLITLDADRPIWERVFTVAPLIVVGTRGDDEYNLAPKHMAMPLSWKQHYGFVCAPHHKTYQNIEATGGFTVSYPRPEQVTAASLTAAPRHDGPGVEKPIVETLPTFQATQIDALFLEDAYLCLECELDRMVDDLDDNSLILGRIVAAHVHEDALRVSEGDDQALLHDAPLLVYLHPGRYATVQNTNAFPFPAGFSR
jgi:flavin reductase (DIM6/NTAB) family NADH-FMN oxidoreductase RutF